jgi:DNA-directed RNA polymerase subunit RPC12/RpoP
MRILDFYKDFPDEISCKEKFKELRLQQGIRCKKCGGTEHYWKKNREQWECKNCTHRTTLKSGTVMENSKLPYLYWFIAMHLLTCTKKSFSAKEVQRELGHKRYQPIWEMMHKIRSVMGLRDDEYSLEKEVELDDGFFETVSITRKKDEPLKRGRGSQKQTTVLVMAESKPVEDEKLSEKYACKKKFGFLKMKVVTGGFKEELFTPIVIENIKKQSSIISDGSTSYTGLKNEYNHNPQTIDKKEAGKMLPWVHKSISNAKRMLLDVHHRIDDDFLQNYLNAFVYKMNRRYFNNLFDRLLIAAVSYRWNYLGETNG